ncbi:archaemetzincin-1 isoform X4 [Prionailurus bengalensis]|uniref:archaemetzincin-1 isoform X4 n=1 Tax=Prionailurus bengalensis TaxID=37029 RepID=UPI001CA812E8|nr:archaemetzincin-1 isoform X4 [Prionailurus bengalensis]
MLQCRPAQEFSFGPRALKEALVSSDPTLRRLYASAFTPAERLFLAEAYNPQRTLFCTLLIHTAFDWLLSRPEAPEDFQTFHASLPPRRQSPARKHIYLQPIDGILSFLKSSKPGDALCVLGLTLSDLYPCEAWSFTFGKFLPGHEVGVCSFARFSGELLQPGPGASEAAPVQAAADGPETPVQDPGQTLCFSALGLAQCCKVTCHELCHLLGLGSCRWLGCIMQGALSLEEALRRPLDLCPICLRKLQHVLGFKLIDRYKRLYAWTRAGSRPDADAGAPSASDETPPCSADSGLSCDSGSEPLTPDTWSHTFSAGPEPEPEEGLGSPAAPDSPPGCGPAVDAIREHGRWLERCIRALEREVTEEELAQVDGAVEALAGWEMFTGRLPAPRQDPPCGRDGWGLRRVLGDTFSSLRRKLSARKLSKAGSSPGRWREEGN